MTLSISTSSSSTRCLYASKPCPNERSLKDNGELHRLCIEHREKARHAQRRWHARQRVAVRPYLKDRSRGPVPLVRPSFELSSYKRRRTTSTHARQDAVLRAAEAAVRAPLLLPPLLLPPLQPSSSFESLLTRPVSSGTNMPILNPPPALSPEDLSFLGEFMFDDVKGSSCRSYEPFTHEPYERDY